MSVRRSQKKSSTVFCLFRYVSQSKVLIRFRFGVVPISDWYTDEHIPLRTQKFASFRSAARYRAIDGIAPKFAAMYTVSDLATFSDPAYTALREQRSERETELTGRLSVIDRRVSIWYLPFFKTCWVTDVYGVITAPVLTWSEILTI
jgi:hypothetical protein